MQTRPMVVKKPRRTKADIEWTRNINAAVYEADRHIGFIFSMVLYDKFDFGLKKLANVQDKIYSFKLQYQEGKVSLNEMREYAHIKDIHCYEEVKKIPMRQKFLLCGLNKKKAAMGIDRYADSALLACFLLLSIPLKTDYKFSKKNMEKLFYWIRYYIDSYARGYVDDDGIVEAFKISAGTDILTGRKLTAEEIKAIS